MFVVGELDRELSFVFRFRSLARAIRFSEDEAPVFARRGTHVTNRANNRARAGERLAREKLLSMTTDTGIMVWKVSNIRKITLCGPCGRNFVAGVTHQTLVFVRRMLEGRVLCRLSFGSWLSWRLPLPSLRRRSHD